MDKLYRKVETKQFPPKAGWYDTDKGNLYWYESERNWSCRDDKLSEEYPAFWYELQSLSVAKEPSDVEGLIEHAFKAGRISTNTSYEQYRKTFVLDSMRSQLPSRNDAVEFAEWISNNQFTMYNNEWTSTKIHYSGCAYTTTELYSLFSSNKEGKGG